MSRRKRDLIKNSKRFHVIVYRWLGNVLFFFVVLNLCLSLVVYYVYFNRPERDYYATYGETAPIMLTPMDEPNYSSLPLLANESNNDSSVRTVPN